MPWDATVVADPLDLGILQSSEQLVHYVEVGSHQVWTQRNCRSFAI